ncbi:MAG: NUDIX hydrolase [Candidatus Liptonbacteria bacterium]|nr:NUDIX hydrolase [Candidatus Liptonbacteria bacterium]
MHMKKLAHSLRFAVLASDTALFTIRDGRLYVRLIVVNRPPFYTNVWGLPGGLLHPKETAEEAALRHLKEKAGIDTRRVYAEQLYTFSEPDRDPRGRVVAVAYLALVPWNALPPREQEDTARAKWMPVEETRRLAYDHDTILLAARARLRSRVTYTTLIQKLMPKEFTLTELETAHESILAADLDKRNFRKKMRGLKILKKRPYKRTGGRSRPAQLYEYASSKITEIKTL